MCQLGLFGILWDIGCQRDQCVSTCLRYCEIFSLNFCLFHLRSSWRDEHETDLNRMEIQTKCGKPSPQPFLFLSWQGQALRRSTEKLWKTASFSPAILFGKQFLCETWALWSFRCGKTNQELDFAAFCCNKAPLRRRGSLFCSPQWWDQRSGHPPSWSWVFFYRLLRKQQQQQQQPQPTRRRQKHAKRRTNTVSRTTATIFWSNFFVLS